MRGLYHADTRLHGFDGYQRHRLALGGQHQYIDCGIESCYVARMPANLYHRFRKGGTRLPCLAFRFVLRSAEPKRGIGVEPVQLFEGIQEQPHILARLKAAQIADADALVRLFGVFGHRGDRIVDDLAGDGDAEFLLPCLLLGSGDEDDVIAVICEASSVDTTHGWLPAVEGCGRFVEMPQMPYACHTGCRDTQDGHAGIGKDRIDAVPAAPTAEVPCCGQIEEPDEQRA